MKLFNLIKKFRTQEDGAVTVDWVVLTGAIVGLGAVVMTSIGGGVSNFADTIGSAMNNKTVTTAY